MLNVYTIGAGILILLTIGMIVLRWRYDTAHQKELYIRVLRDRQGKIVGAEHYEREK